MLRLIVLRHAKSSWAVPGAIDIDRELNDRGRSDLEKLSRAIVDRKISPDHIICSTAVRTRQTLEGIFDAFDPEPTVTYEPGLYSGGTRDYKEVIRSHSKPECLMLIGHNPMCGSLVTNLYGSGNEEHFARIALKYPTGTLSVLDFDIQNWSELAANSGHLKACLLPRKLP